MNMKLSFTILEFCEAHSISRGTFYRLLKRGEAPRLMTIERGKRVSAEAAAEWRARMELPPSERLAARTAAGAAGGAARQ
jgi:predicted DNA-binding transcriptional regulator AlpA